MFAYKDESLYALNEKGQIILTLENQEITDQTKLVIRDKILYIE
ncbi:hypothetical protein [Streptococcus timonensis]